jgi:hypothetical protein
MSAILLSSADLRLLTAATVSAFSDQTFSSPVEKVNRNGGKPSGSA